GKGDIIFKSIKNGKYLLCGEGEPLFIPDGIGYYTGYNLYLIDTETKEKIHLLGYENAKLERIQFGKSVKEVKDGGDIVSLILHPDENRVFYIDKNCALWEFKIENKEKKRLTEDYRVVPNHITIDKSNFNLWRERKRRHLSGWYKY
ncbi:MAG: hypothetical protein H5U37_05220, partial [Caldisericia bacterium]|nr:hypothetical protein [Caldisericia bacterium]